MNKRKGIVLAGGTGSRLAPLTKVVSKQLMPIYNKPMIYYPIATLMLSDITDILIITTKTEQDLFIRLLGDGSDWGLNFQYKTQNKPEGIAQAFLIGEEFIDSSPIALILGDNLFHGSDLSIKLERASKNTNASIFLYSVDDPKRYGIVEIDENKKIKSIIEKPIHPKSNFAVTGLYFYDHNVAEYAKSIKPSARGELEITSINQIYLKEKKLNFEILGRGSAWLDTGTFETLNEAGSYIKTLEKRQGLQIGCPEEIAWRKGWIDDYKLGEIAKKYNSSEYGKYLKKLLG